MGALSSPTINRAPSNRTAVEFRAADSTAGDEQDPSIPETNTIPNIRRRRTYERGMLLPFEETWVANTAFNERGETADDAPPQRLSI